MREIWFCSGWISCSDENAANSVRDLNIHIEVSICGTCSAARSVLKVEECRESDARDIIQIQENGAGRGWSDLVWSCDSQARACHKWHEVKLSGERRFLAQ